MSGKAVIYLDTHVAVWLYQKDRELLSQRALDLIEANETSISPAVLLELEYLFEVFRITEHGESIVDYLHKQIGVKICDKPFQAVVRKALELKWTRDPFDRLITAQAALSNDILLTKDTTIAGFYSRAVW